MKTNELIELLSNYPDYEIKLSYCEEPQEGDRFLNIHSFVLDGVNDIGHSDKVIILGLEEK